MLKSLWDSCATFRRPDVYITVLGAPHIYYSLHEEQLYPSLSPVPFLILVLIQVSR